MKAVDRVPLIFGILLLLSFRRADAQRSCRCAPQVQRARNTLPRGNASVFLGNLVRQLRCIQDPFMVGKIRSDQWQYRKMAMETIHSIPPDIRKEGYTRRSHPRPPCFIQQIPREWSFASLYRKEYLHNGPRPDPALKLRSATGLEGRFRFANKLRGKNGYIFLTSCKLKTTRQCPERKLANLCFDKLTCILCFVNDETPGIV